MSSRAPRYLSFLLALAAMQWPLPVAAAESRCVDSVAEFTSALIQAEAGDVEIKVVQGVYAFDSDPMQVAEGRSLSNGVVVSGGYDSTCSKRELDPLLTVFTGADSAFNIRSRESVEIDSVAFIGLGKLGFHAKAHGRQDVDPHVSLSRVWLENMCASDICSDESGAVLVDSERVSLSQVVAIGHAGTHCAVEIDAVDLLVASVEYSLFADNGGDGVCVTRTMPDGNYRLQATNNVFWNNAGDDLVTRGSEDIDLHNNLYESLDSMPLPARAPVGAFHQDPQFVDPSARNYRLKPGSPAIHSGLSDSRSHVRVDIEGKPRWGGNAPDLGPYAAKVTGSHILVTNATDSLSSPAIGSLRWAINQANANNGTDSIDFAINGSCPQMIDLQGPLPNITENVWIDGYTQPGSMPATSDIVFNATICIGIRGDFSTNHALQIPSGEGEFVSLVVDGIGFGGFDVAAIRIASGKNSWIRGNQFGGELEGVALGNSAVNIRLGGTSHDNLIGGDHALHRNLIMFAWNAGIELLDNSSGADGYDNRIENNFIGTNAGGTGAAPNNIGVRVKTSQNTISENVISGNQSHGVVLEGSLANDNFVSSNRIGVKSFAICFPLPCEPDYALGNIGAGVLAYGGVSDTFVGSNTVAYNGSEGIRFWDGVRNSVRHNQVFDNESLGIDIGAIGVNPIYNASDPDTEDLANRGINAPELDTAYGGARRGRVTGSIYGFNGSYTIEWFVSDACDASGRGEGEHPIQEQVVEIDNQAPDQNGTLALDLQVYSNVDLESHFITAILRNPFSGDSEFSNCVAYVCDTIFANGFTAEAEVCDPP